MKSSRLITLAIGAGLLTFSSITVWAAEAGSCNSFFFNALNTYCGSYNNPSNGCRCHEAAEVGPYVGWVCSGYSAEEDEHYSFALSCIDEVCGCSMGIDY